MKKALWFSLGLLLLGIAFVGVVIPGIPWSTPAVGAAFCFAKSSDRMHAWLYNHHIFGPFLTNWQSKKVFPEKAKYLMLLTMSSSLAILYFTTFNLAAVGYLFATLLIIAIWSWRYPGSVEEYEDRVANNRKIGWFS